MDHAHPHDHPHHRHPPHGDSHDGEHDGEHDRTLGHVRALFRRIVGHSHDSADHVDRALEASEDGIRALRHSLLVLAATAIGQAVVVRLSGSVALLGDTLHNVADALTAVPLWIAFVLGRRPANDRYTYGFGRAEDLAGLFIVVVIAISALTAGWQAIDRLRNPAPVQGLAWVAAAGLVGFVGNELAARIRIRTGRRIGSAALVADGLHARTDGFTSLAVLAGAAGVASGWQAADPIVGLLIALAIAVVTRNAARSVYLRLMDAVDPSVVLLARTTAAGAVGVERVDAVRVRWIGHHLEAEVEVSVAAGQPAETAHAVAHQVEHELLHAVGHLRRATVHVGSTAGGEPDPHDLVAHHR